MEKIPEEILVHITKAYGYDRELFERLVDAFDMGDDGFVAIRDEAQNICAFGFVGHTNYIYYGRTLKAGLVSCLGVTKFGGTKDLIEILKKIHLYVNSEVDITMYEITSERFERIYTRFTDGSLLGGDNKEFITQEEALAYSSHPDVSLRQLTADAFYPLYEQWIREQDYQFAITFTYDNIKKLEECIHLIAAYDTNGKVVGLTIVHRDKHYYSDYLEPIIFDAPDEHVRKTMIHYLAENHGRSGRDLLIRTYGRAGEASFQLSSFVFVSNTLKTLGIYAQAHSEEDRIIHLVSDKAPETSGYYTIRGGVATYTKELVEGAERMTHKELNRLLIPYSNCCFFF